MPKYSKKVSVVIPTYNRKEKLLRLIRSIFNSDYKNIEIIVIDDHSKYNIEKILISTFGKKRNIKVIRNDHELFVSCCRNIGIEKSKGEYIFLIDDDNIVDKKCISELVNTLETRKDAGAATPITFYLEEPNIIWRAGVNFNLITSRGHVPFKNVNMANITDIPRYIECNTAPNAILVRKKIANIVKYDNEKFPFDHEDIDFCFRIRKLGYKILCCTAARVWHDIPFKTTSCRKMNIESGVKAYLSGKNKILFHRRHSSPIQLLIFMTLFLPPITIHRICSILLDPELKINQKLDRLDKFLVGLISGIFK